MIQRWTDGRNPGLRHWLGVTLVSSGVLLLTGVVVAVLERVTGAGELDLAPVFLVAVVVIGTRYGTGPALAAALVAFLANDFLFVDPRLTFEVSDPRQWLDLMLFLMVAIAIGRLSAQGAERAANAVRRAREAESLYSVSRRLATTGDLAEAIPGIVDELARETDAERAWVVLGGPPRERVAGDSLAHLPLPASTVASTLTRDGSTTRWVRAHVGRARAASPSDSITAPTGRDRVLYRIPIAVEGVTLGWMWITRLRELGDPTAEESRLLATAADQLGLAIHREQLAREAVQVEVARQSDALKSALVDSVSHELRTPLARIRAAAGMLLDPAVRFTPADVRSTAAAVDSEAERLGRLVRDLLDVSRIEAGSLRADLAALDLEDAVSPVVDRLRPLLGPRAVNVVLPPELPPVWADALLLDHVIANLVENVARHTPPAAPLWIRAETASPGGKPTITLVIEDGGDGVPEDELPRLFEKFHRVNRGRRPRSPGLGLGLTVVSGLVGAMDGTVSAVAGAQGGLAVRVELPQAALEPAEAGVT